MLEDGLQQADQELAVLLEEEDEARHVLVRHGVGAVAASEGLIPASCTLLRTPKTSCARTTTVGRVQMAGARMRREVATWIPRGSRHTLNVVAAFDRITSDPACLNGQPCVRNLRLTVRRVLEALALYPNREELLREYPELEQEDLRQVLAYAATMLDDRGLDLPKSA